MRRHPDPADDCRLDEAMAEALIDWQEDHATEPFFALHEFTDAGRPLYVRLFNDIDKARGARMRSSHATRLVSLQTGEPVREGGH